MPPLRSNNTYQPTALASVGPRLNEGSRRHKLSHADQSARLYLPQSGVPMKTVIPFPSRDERQWSGVAQALSAYLATLGVTSNELQILLGKLRVRWETLGAPYDFKPSYELVDPLSAERLQSIDAAMQSLVAEIVNHQKAEHAATLLQFAQLEFEILRLQP